MCVYVYMYVYEHGYGVSVCENELWFKDGKNLQMQALCWEEKSFFCEAQCWG